ncbi:MAG TPA: ABC transporter substrate-binding protein [Pedococcus sp.]|nr:ABC transporter substrate-binding protein [Pedococcus sp.]
MSKRTRSAALLAAVATVLTACSGVASGPSGVAGAAYRITTDTPKPTRGIDSFSWALYAEPLSLDYALAFDYPPNQVLANVCESLLRWNPDLTVSPGLAEKFANPTPTTWVYTIRQGVTFHDGSPLTAADVVASLRRHLDPRVGSYWASAFINVASIVQTGQHQVTVTLKRPDSLFNQFMAVTPGTIESAKTLARDGKAYGSASAGVNCTGPFSLASWKQGDSLTLKRYAGYWDASRLAKAGSVKFVFLADPITRVNAWTAGEVDGGWLVPANAYAKLTSSGAGTLYHGVNTTVVSEVVTRSSGVLADKRVRQALLMATDRAGLVKTGEQGVGDVATSMVSRSSWGGVSAGQLGQIIAKLPSYRRDVTAAKALAKAAGVNGQRIVIATSPIIQSADAVTAAVAQAAKDIGLQPTIQTVSPASYTAMFTDPAARKGVDLMLTAWYTSLADPMDFYGALHTGQFSNYGGWSNKAFDAAADLAVATPLTDPRRPAIVAKAQQIAMDELPWLPMYTLPTSVWLGKRITGVKPSINFLYYPWAASIGAN